MQIKTEFGEVNIAKDSIITFEDGLYGFEDVKNYVILREDGVEGISFLQSTLDIHPSFVLLDPFDVLRDFEPKLSNEDIKYFNSSDSLKFMLIAIVGQDYSKTVVNLKNPIVIDALTQKGKQVILENDYPLRYPLFENEGGNK